MSFRSRHLAVGAIFIVLAIVALATSSWIPLIVLGVAGAFVVGRGLTVNAR